jgi:PAS domain S-box-containing protein
LADTWGSGKTDTQIVQAAPWGMHFYELKGDGRLVFLGANPAADRILGIDHSKLIGMAIDDAFPSLDPEVTEAYRHVAHTGEIWRSERINYEYGQVKGAFSVTAFQTAPDHMSAAFVDVTERIQIHEKNMQLLAAAQREKDTLQMLMDSMTDEVWFADADKKFTLANAAALKSFRLEDSVIDLDVQKFAGNLEVYRPDGTARPTDESPPLRALRGESVRNEEEIIRLPQTGELRYRRVTSNPVRDHEGKIIGSVSVVRDTTEKREAEVLLRESRNYLENLFNYTNAPIIVWDPSFKITQFNHAFERMTGYEAGDVIGKHLRILFPAGSKDESLIMIDRTLKGEQWDSVEIPIQRRDGLTRVALWNSANIRSDDGKAIIATIAQGQDITERKAVEIALDDTRKYLENLFDYANAPIIVWDPTFHVTRFNHAFEHMTGLKASEVIGKHLDILFPPESKDESLIMISHTLSGQHWDSVEIPILTMKGEVKVALWNSANIYAEDGRTLTATIAQGQDITERKDAEMRLLEYSESLSRSNAELQNFAYVASHDLREPLRTISGFLQILQTKYGDSLDDKAKDYIARSVNASVRLHNMIDDLLSFSRLETRKKPFAKTDLNEVYTAAMHDLEQSLTESGASVKSDRLPVVWADDQQMTIVFRNLIDNGVKFHGKEKPKVRVTVKKDEDEWLFSFEDNGIGIDTANISKIFNMFTRLHSWKDYPGNGIGLAMCKKIIERHGGHIWVESKVGKGSNFMFTIPDQEAISDRISAIEMPSSVGKD